MSVETIRFRNIMSVLPQAPAASLRPDLQRGSLKTKRDASDRDDRLAKPDWIRVKVPAPATTIEILTPDFGGRLDRALDILAAAPPDVLNHNIETVPRLYKEARPGADSQNTLDLLQRFKAGTPGSP